MPNIPEFTATENISPNESAALTAIHVGDQRNRFARETGNVIGRSISQVGGQIGERIDNHIAAQWIGHGSAVSSDLFSNLVQQWNETAAKADPNDTSIGQGFREKNLNPSIDKFQEQFADAPDSVQRWALQTADKLREHLSNKIQADEGIRAGAAVTQNIQATARNLSNTVGNDPSALPDSVAMLDANAKAFMATHPHLTAEESAKLNAELVTLKRGLATSAFDGMVDKNPLAASALLARGDFDQYFDKQQKEKLTAYARTKQKEKETDDEHKQLLIDKEKKRVSEDSFKTYTEKLLNGQPLTGYTSDKTLTGEQQWRIKEMQHAAIVQARDNSENQPHPKNLRSVIDNIQKTNENDPAKLSDKPIYEAYNKGELNKTEFAFALSIYGSKDKAYEKQVNIGVRRAETMLAASIQGATLKLDPEQYAGALNQFEANGRKWIADATTPEERNKRLDPTSPDYAFSQARLNALTMPPKQAISGAADKVRAGERAPGNVRQIKGAEPLKPALPPAPPAAVAYLKAHPETKEQFKTRFGYLPE